MGTGPQLQMLLLYLVRTYHTGRPGPIHDFRKANTGLDREHGRTADSISLALNQSRHGMASHAFTPTPGPAAAKARGKWALVNLVDLLNAGNTDPPPAGECGNGACPCHSNLSIRSRGRADSWYALPALLLLLPNI